MTRLIRGYRWLLLMGLLAAPHADAQPGRRAVEAGNQLYTEGRYDEAHEQYLEALREAPDSAVAPFNDGNALYRNDAIERAAEAYQQATESGDPLVEAQAWYNLGNALYRQQQLEPALEAYKEALRRDPTDTDAKHNLELALQQLEQQQQQPSEDQQNQDEQEPQDSEGQQNQEESQNGDDRTRPEDTPQPENPDETERNTPREDQSGQDQPDKGGDSQPPGEESAPPGELSREEAERLLQAINEDPSQIQRRRRTTAPARPPRRPW
ncbi:MAG: tetratricopeptide repeat protein [Acidobacteriota bacterium]|nr:tetratricopeptide repeat protein [Acidobacteriota bacterium]